MKLKEIFDQSDTIIELWPEFKANCFCVGSPCRSTFNLYNYTDCIMYIGNWLAGASQPSRTNGAILLYIYYIGCCVGHL